MPTRRTLALTTVLLAIAGAIAWLSVATYDAPAGQPPLAYLDGATIGNLKAEFNAAAADTRIVVLLSPT